MSTPDVLRAISLVLACGLIAQPVADLLRLPHVIVLVAAGAILGPSITGLLDVSLSSSAAGLVFSLGVSVILLYGGLGTSIRVVARTGVGIGMLVIPGVLLTAFCLALAIAPLFDVRFAVALLVGAVLAATDPAILIPLFDRLSIRPKVAQTVVVESALNDPTGTVLALTLASAVAAGHISVIGPLGDFLRNLAIGTALGIAAGVGLALMMSSRRTGIWKESPAAAVLGVVAFSYFLNDRFGGSAYMAAFVMGLIVGNANEFGLRRHPEHAPVLDTFVGQVTEITVVAVFVILGANLPFDRLESDLVPGLVLMAAFVFLIRPLAVFACLAVDRRSRWTLQEKLFLCWCRETGVVPAALASLLVARQVEGGELAVTLVAMAVCVTLLLQATTAGYVARRLGLTEGSEAVAGVLQGAEP